MFFCLQCRFDQCHAVFGVRDDVQNANVFSLNQLEWVIADRGVWKKCFTVSFGFLEILIAQGNYIIIRLKVSL